MQNGRLHDKKNKKTVVLRIISSCIFLLQMFFSSAMTYRVVLIVAGPDNEIWHKSITNYYAAATRDARRRECFRELFDV